MTAIAKLPLFDRDPPRTIEDLEAAFEIRFKQAHAGQGSVTVQHPAPAITQVRMSFSFGWLEDPSGPDHVAGYRGRRADSWTAEFSEGLRDSEPRFVERFGEPQHGLVNGRPFGIYGPFVVQGDEDTWTLTWYERLPDWTAIGVAPQLQLAALQQFVMTIADLDSIEDVAHGTHFEPATGIHRVALDRPGWLQYQMRPGVPAHDLAAALDWRLVVVSDHGSEDHLGHSTERIVSEDAGTIVLELPTSGRWLIGIDLEGYPPGKELAYAVREIGPTEVIRTIFISQGTATRTPHERTIYGFVHGDELDEIVAHGSGCFTGQRLPEPVFVSQAVRFAWFPPEPEPLWDLLGRLASDGGDREIYGVAGRPWIEANVGVLRIPTHVRALDFRELLDAHTPYGVPQVLWFFGRSREWAVIVDREIGLAVGAVIRPYYDFKKHASAGMISLEDAIELACARTLEEERGALAARFRANYANGSWER